MTSIQFADQSQITGLGYGGTSMSFDLAYFPNLKNLIVPNSGYTSLDFIPTNIKKQLVELNCANNEITELNLEEYPNMQFLFCNHNSLTKLNVYAVSGLIKLNCHNNFIKELDITSGVQKNNLDMVLTLTDAQKDWWNNHLKNEYSNGRVYFKDEEPESGNFGTGATDFPVGGIY